MAYTEKVLLSGTAFSFLYYECINSANSQEGFLLGNITSEITNHISDSQSDNARLDTQILIRTVLPLPSVSLFYFPTGRIKEDVLSDLISGTANDVVGWYKYRKNTNIKPTFRDKLISKGLQKYFEKRHSKKTFVTCNLTSKPSPSGATHTFMYRFGKINCLDMYEYVEDVTANLGEKFTGYKKAHRQSPHSIFMKIVADSKVQSNNTSDAILHIQEAVDVRLATEAKIAAKNESTVKEIAAEIKEMSHILAEKHFSELQASFESYRAIKNEHMENEMAQACLDALQTPLKVETLNVSKARIPFIYNENTDVLNTVQYKETKKETKPITSPVSLSTTKPVLNYADALKSRTEVASTSKDKRFCEDLITFDVEDRHTQKNVYVSEDDDNSTEY